MNHLVIYNQKLFGRDYIALMLSGDKTFGCKFRTNRTVPYEKLQNGDYLYLKESSGPLRGRVRVSQVHNMELTDPDEALEFLAKYSQEIGIQSETQLIDIWRQNVSRRYLCYWRMEEPEIIRYPVFVQKRDRRAWVMGYEPGEDVTVAFL
jgi:hypothetical protein